ncbi:MAG: hypothetical protein P8R54_01170 [Myxococcota bacterium]|nr:hypothetical protein [Myxococcota bacterium]
MLIYALLIACGTKQAEPETPIDEATAPPDDAAEAAPGDAAEAAPSDAAGAAPSDAAEAAPSDAAAACPEGSALYEQQNVPLRAPGDAAMQWSLTIHDTGYWSNTAPNGTQTGCLTAEELAGFIDALAAAEIAAPPLQPGMARCMAMPMTEYTVTAGEQSATWKGPCGETNPSASLSALLSSIESLSYGR